MQQTCQAPRPELHIQTAIPMCQGSQIRIFASATEAAWKKLQSSVLGLGTLRVPNGDDEQRSKEDCWLKCVVGL